MTPPLSGAAPCAAASGLFRALADQSTAIVWALDETGRCIFVGRSWTDVTSLSEADSLGQGWTSAVNPADLDAFLSVALALKEGGIERRLRLLEGGRYAWFTVNAVRTDEGWLVSADRALSQDSDDDVHVTIALDATAQRAAEAKLRATRDKLQATLSNITDGVLMLDCDWRYTYFSDRGAEMLGMRPDELLGARVWDAFPHAEGTRFHESYHRAVRSREPVHFEEFYPAPLNKWLECHCYPDDDGLTVYFRDVTERRLAEEQLRRNHETFHRLVQSNPFGLYVVDADFRLIEVSLGAQKVFAGVQPLIGRDFEEVLRLIWPEPFVGQVLGVFRHTLATGEPYRSPSTVERRADIDEVEAYDWRVERLALPDGRFGVVCHFYDLSDRQRWEGALRESEERFRSMADGLPLVVWVHDGSGRQEWVNQTFCELFGVTREEMRDARWQLLTHPEDGAAYIDAFLAAVKDRAPFHAEVRARGADGQWIWLESWGRPRFNSDRAYIGHIGVSADITERKRVDEALHEADRHKDEFLATLAHELRNPLAPIRAGIEVLRRKASDTPAAQRAREIIDRQSQHMVRLVDDLLDVGRITHGKLELRAESTSLESAVRQALEACAPHFERSHRELVVLAPAEPIHVNADPVRLTQVVTNLLYNAHKYSGVGSRIELSMTREEDMAVVRVRDNGIGISPDRLPQVFQMFMQDQPALERSQSGLGIGLALAEGLVRAHGGTIEATSAGVGEGSEFIVRLPALAQMSNDHRTAEAAAASTLLAAPRRVLLVDDNRDAADTLSVLLGSEGCDVRVAYCGADALKMAQTWQPDLALVDIGLPDLNGYQVCAALRAELVGHEMRVAALTGWGQDDDRRRTREAGFDEHFVKPVNFDALLDFISERPRV